MHWQNHPDPSFTADATNDYIGSESQRRAVKWAEAFRFLMGGAGVFLLLLVVIILGVVTGPGGLMIGLPIVGLLAAGVWELGRRAFRGAALRCTQCSQRMKRRWHNTGAGGDIDLYYECPPCRRYIYTGVSSGG